ncbi:pentatricopeptide repeat-containing protein DOT4, chloroplastic [Cucumis sativus]|uniref:pentatricopeptide repeat-containing protein DOT4, chloroplastic n=1 Tax=Cucumis sativus TaxID=3659 RepID=UPI0002B4ABE6|nr:pentatricopeptide repeat-containing protein DOT4, chloroplastic [Cucumis sativus]
MARNIFLIANQVANENSNASFHIAVIIDFINFTWMCPLSFSTRQLTGNEVSMVEQKKIGNDLGDCSICLDELSPSNREIIITNPIYGDQFLVAKLVAAYSSLGCLENARKVFDEIPQPKTVLCNAMVNGYLQNERYNDCIELLKMMSRCHLEFDSYTCNFALKACMFLLDYEMGMEVIGLAVCKGLAGGRFLGSSILNFLVKTGDIMCAQFFFHQMVEKDVVCWNVMIGGFMQEGLFREGYNLFLDMLYNKIEPSAVTMISLIQSCGEMRNLTFGKCMHGFVLGFGMSRDTRVLTTLIDMYCKSGDVESARWIFENMPSRNLVSWNVMISGYVQNGLLVETLRLFQKLIMDDVGFDSGTVVSLIQLCSRTADLDGGKILHGFIYRRGLDLNLVLPTAIVDLYAKCGSLAYASSVFERMKNKNVISWTAMLVGLAQNGHARDALKLFDQMQNERVTFNALTLVSLVYCCTLLGLLREGRSVHATLTRFHFASEVVVMTALIDMYAKCSKINSAEMVFKYGLTPKDVILYNSMISGYGMHGLGHKALCVYHRMNREGLQPNESTFVSLLSACSHSGLVEEGIALFQNMVKDHNTTPTDKLYACIVDLLSRAGRLRQAEELINQMPFTPTSGILETLLNGCLLHKDIELGVKLADRLLSLESRNPSIYITLSNIYAKASRWDSVKYVRGLMMEQEIKKIPGYSSIEVNI